MSWKHEEPLEEVIADAPSLVQANALESYGDQAREASTQRLFEPCIGNESDNRQTSDILNTSQQGSSAGIDSAGWDNGSAERSLYASHSSRPEADEEIRSPAGKALSPSKRQ